MRNANRGSRKLLLRAALGLGLIAALVGAASAVAAGPTTPVKYSKAVCAAVPVGKARCNSYVVTNKAGKPLASPNAVSGYGPVQFQTAYGLTAAAAAPTNEVVAIVDAFDNPNAKADLDVYSQQLRPAGDADVRRCAGRRLLQEGEPDRREHASVRRHGLGPRDRARRRDRSRGLPQLRHPAGRGERQQQRQPLRRRGLRHGTRQHRFELVERRRICQRNDGRLALQPPGCRDHRFHGRLRLLGDFHSVSALLALRDRCRRNEPHPQREQHARERNRVERCGERLQQVRVQAGLAD